VNTDFKAKKIFFAVVFCFIMFNCIFFTSVSHAASTDFKTSSDYFVDNSGNYPNGDTLYNAMSGNWVGSAIDPVYGEAQAAVKFDLSALAGTVSVSDAQLKIYINDILGTPDLYKLYGSNADAWLETATTIPSKDTLLNTNNGVIVENQWITVNVTSFVQSQMSTDKIMSFVLTGNTTGDKSFNFNSKESLSNKPTLSVTYTIQSNNANLNGLTLSSGPLSPAFSSATTSYSADVPNSMTSVDITPTVADSTATIKVDSANATSGSPSSVTLSPGPNTIAVTVTAQDGTVKTYTVTVTVASVPDTTPPVTTAGYSEIYAPGNSTGWQISDIKLTLSASDDISGVKMTEYRMNGGGWNVYAVPIMLSQNGTFTYEFRSTDNAGNVENTQSIVLKIDKAAPVTKYHFDPIYDKDMTGRQYIKGYTTTLKAIDNVSGSGINIIQYRINGGTWIPYTSPFTIYAGATHTVEYYSTDSAGNEESPINKMDFDKGIFTGAGKF
jgi:hypothetical protein